MAVVLLVLVVVAAVVLLLLLVVVVLVVAVVMVLVCVRCVVGTHPAGAPAGGRQRPLTDDRRLPH